MFAVTACIALGTAAHLIGAMTRIILLDGTRLDPGLFHSGVSVVLMLLACMFTAHETRGLDFGRGLRVHSMAVISLYTVYLALTFWV